ncbi:hypothetical protein MJM45_32080, partial [Salmonella enterica subsp. enterica serovar Kentucky]|nr:hypothetical protein [Salmonella enterica subsp. enterica serovar Kentucky]
MDSITTLIVEDEPMLAEILVDTIKLFPQLATFTAVPENITDPLQTLPIYTGVFSKIGLVTLAVTVVMAIMV